MKKSFKRIFTAACFTAGLALILSGCAYPNSKITGQDTAYAVTSNGGSVVQYGDYVYFINGTDAAFDATKENRWGEVVKGGIYRVKIENGKTVTKKDGDGVEYKTYERAGSDYLDVNMRKDVTNFNEDEKKITLVDESHVQKVVPKYARIAGDAYAGIFIYDGWIYYSSPNTRKDKTGTIDYGLSDFFRTKVDGKGTQRIYSSKEAVTDYNFYHYNGKVYLLCAEGESLISVPVGKSAGKVLKLTDGITEVYFPRRETYYKDINENTAADYVYYVRALNSDDNSSEGNVLECRRPDLNEDTGVQVFDNNNTYGIAGSDGNTLFYYETAAMGDARGRKDLYAQPNFDLWVKIALNSMLPEKKQEVISAVPADRQKVINGVTESMTQVMVFNNLPKTASGDPVGYSAMVLSDSNIYYYSGSGVRYGVASGVTAINKVADGMVYFTGSSGALYSVFAAQNQTPVQHTSGAFYSSVDMAADMFWFFGQSLEQVNFEIELREESVSANYMFIKRAVGGADKDTDEFFIGEVGPDELPPEEEE